MADESLGHERLARWARSKLRPERRRRAREQLSEAAKAGDLAALGVLAQLGDPPGAWATAMWRELWPMPAFPEFDRVLEAFTAMGLDPDPSTLTPAMRDGVLRAAQGLHDHPVGRAARAKIVAHADTDPDLVDEVCRAACRPPDPEGLLSFCAEHGLEPNDPVEAARFFAFTDRARYREHDPDGSLLVTAFRSSDEVERMLLGQVTVAAADRDLLRRMLEPELPSLSLETSEAHEHLARLEDWPTLWRLATYQPTFEMAGLSGLFPPDWVPDSAAERRIYAAARALRDERWPEITDVVSVIPKYRRLEFFYRVSTSHGGAQMAAIEGRRLATSPLPEQSVQVFDGADDPVATYPYDSVMPAQDQLLHLGDDVTLTGGYRELTLYKNGRVTSLVQERVDALVTMPGGYAALTQGHLVLGDVTGRITDRIRLASLGLPDPNPHGQTSYLAARTDGALAIAVAGEILIDPTGRNPRRATLRHAQVSAIAFDDERLAVAAWGRDGGGARALRYLDPSGELEPYGAEELPASIDDVYGDVHRMAVRRLDALPGLRALLFTEGWSAFPGSATGNMASTVRVVGGVPLDPILTEPEQRWVQALGVEAGRYLAIARAPSEYRHEGGAVTVHDLHRTMAQELLFRPMSELKTYHPDVLEGLPPNPWLALLRARLESPTTG